MNFFADTQFREPLLRLLSDNVLEETAVRNFYTRFSGECPTTTEDRNILVQPKDKVSEKQGVPTAARLCGIDLPAWIEGPSKDRLVMTISQDPLRNEEAFAHPVIQANPEKDCVLSTPWAAHLGFQLPKGERTTQTMKKMHQLATALTEKGISLFLTDLYKTFFRMPGGRESVLCWTKEDRGRHRQILMQEMEIINPDLIVVFGNEALGALEKLFGKRKPDGYIYSFEDLDKPVLHLVHPAAWGEQKRFFKHFSSVHEVETNSHQTAILNVLSSKGNTGL